MKFTKIILLIITVAIVAAVIFVFWNKSQREKLILANPPVEQLLFLRKAGEEFTPEQQKSISEFKEKILARAKIGVKLTEKEKQNFAVVISDNASIFPNGEMVVNQSVLRFSSAEIQSISNALLVE